MNAKEKAEELFDKFYFAKDEDGYHSMNEYRAKQCALIAINEIIKLITNIEAEHAYGFNSNEWQEVKTEIEKL